MDNIRVYSLLQKVLRNIPDDVLLLIMETYSVPFYVEYCPSCRREKYKDESLGYLKYCQNSRKMFGEKSWELCNRCWVNDFNVCPKCWMPYVESELLLQSTGVINGRVCCKRCSESTEFHIQHLPNDKESDNPD